MERSPGLPAFAPPARADQPKPKTPPQTPPRQPLAPGAAQLLAQRAGPVIRQAPPGATPQAAAAGLSCTARAKPAPQSHRGPSHILPPPSNCPTPRAAAGGLSCTARAKPAPQSDGGLAIIVRPCANGLRSLFMKNKKVSAGAQTLPIHGLCMTHS